MRRIRRILAKLCSAGRMRVGLTLMVRIGGGRFMSRLVGRLLRWPSRFCHFARGFVAGEAVPWKGSTADVAEHDAEVT